MFEIAKLAALLFFLALSPANAGALVEDGGCAADGGTCPADGGIDDGGVDAGVPVACDGGLCDTTYGASCSSTGSRPVDLAAFLLVVVGTLVPVLRRRAARRSMSEEPTP